jgi:hypothetical protein
LEAKFIAFGEWRFNRRQATENWSERSEMSRKASCACGNLQALCSGEPIKVSLCHCLDCQRRTGSTYGIAAFFDREDVVTQGSSKTFSRSSDSGFPVIFHFCPECGATVFWEPKRLEKLIAVAVGAFADPAFPPPSQAVYLEHRHAWLAQIIGNR